MRTPLRRCLLAIPAAVALAACETDTSSDPQELPATVLDMGPNLPPVVGEGGGGGMPPSGGPGSGGDPGPGPGPGDGGAGGGGDEREPYCREGIEEVCGDDFDNNCDGRVDEGCTCVSPEKPCYTGDPLDLEVENGQCRAGTQACELEFYGPCTGEVLPGEEVCDGQDNDCDGVTDDLPDCNNEPPEAICPPDQAGPTLADYHFDGDYDDPDGDPMASATWTILEKPPGSTSVPNPEDALDTSIFADLQGTYTLELTVTDARGGVGRCQTHLTTGSDDLLRVEMVWNVGARQDRSDMDLHMKRAPDAQWFDEDDAGDDCFYVNCRVCDASYSLGDEEVEVQCRQEIAEYNNDPNRDPPPQVEWSAPLDDDDPRLDLDDVEGGGPENINIRTPRDGTYRIGVHAYEDEGFGRSTVSLRVFCAGRMAAELGPTVLEPTGSSGEDPTTEFWEVADVTWRGADCEVRPLGDRQCPQVCSRGEAQLGGGCPEGFTRGRRCP